MLGLGYVKSGIRRVGEALHSFAETLEQLNSGLRSQANLDAPDNELPPVVAARVASLPAAEQEGEANGEAQPAGKKGRKS